MRTAKRVHGTSASVRASWGYRLILASCGVLSFLLCSVTPTGAFMIGRLDVVPRLELEWMYDDNIWLRDTGDPGLPVVEDWVGRVRPGLLLTYDYRATGFSIGYRTAFDFYMGPKSLFDRILNTATRQDSLARDHDLTLSARRELGPRTSIAITDTLRIGTDVADLLGALPGEGLEGLPSAGILPEPSDYRINRTGVTFAHGLSRRVSLVADGGYRYSWYGEVERDGVLQSPVREEHQADATLGFTYAWRPQNTASLTVRGSYTDYGRRGEAKGAVVTLGNAWQLTEAFSLFVSLGGHYVNEQTDFGRRHSEAVIPAVNLGTTWQLTEALSLSVSLGVQYLNELEQVLVDETLLSSRSDYVRPIGDAALSYVFRDFVFSATGSAGFVSDSLYLGTSTISREGGVTASWQPWTALTLYASGGYSKEEALFAGDSVYTEAYQGAGGVSYRFRPWLSSSFRYTYVNRNALGSRGTSYTNNRFILGVSLSLPESLG